MCGSLAPAGAQILWIPISPSVPAKAFPPRGPHLPTASSHAVTVPDPSLLPLGQPPSSRALPRPPSASFPSLWCFESLVHVSQAFVFFFFFLSEYVSYFLKFYFIVVSTLGLRSTCHTALLTVGMRSCRRSPELTPCLTLFLDLLLCFAVRNV